jgi:hypothetical protein
MVTVAGYVPGASLLGSAASVNVAGVVVEFKVAVSQAETARGDADGLSDELDDFMAGEVVAVTCNPEIGSVVAAMGI